MFQEHERALLPECNSTLKFSPWQVHEPNAVARRCDAIQDECVILERHQTTCSVLTDRAIRNPAIRFMFFIAKVSSHHCPAAKHRSPLLMNCWRTQIETALEGQAVRKLSIIVVHADCYPLQPCAFNMPLTAIAAPIDLVERGTKDLRENSPVLQRRIPRPFQPVAH